MSDPALLPKACTEGSGACSTGLPERRPAENAQTSTILKAQNYRISQSSTGLGPIKGVIRLLSKHHSQALDGSRPWFEALCSTEASKTPQLSGWSTWRKSYTSRPASKTHKKGRGGGGVVGFQGWLRLQKTGFRGAAL